MSKTVIAVSPDTTMAEFREILHANRISGAPVVHDGRVVGIVSVEDLIKALAAGELGATIGEKMAIGPATLSVDEPLVQAVSKFSSLGSGRFPVVNQSGELVGIITQGDIIRTLLKRLETNYHRKEGIPKHRPSHIFEGIVADQVTLILTYHVAARDFSQAGEAASRLKKTLNRAGFHPQVVRRLVVATYEAELNMVIYSNGGKIIAQVQPELIKIEAIDQGPGIPDIELAMQPGFSTAPDWVRDMGFGAGMGLPNIKACSDEIHLESQVGVGTHLTIAVYVAPQFIACRQRERCQGIDQLSPDAS